MGVMKRDFYTRVAAWLLVIVAVGVVVHAPLMVWLSTVWADGANYAKAWKEILTAVALVAVVVAAYRRGKVRELLQDRLVQLSLAYAVLHFVVLGILWNGVEQAQAGLLIDLRYVLYFVVLYMLLRLEPGYVKWLLKAYAAGAVVVLGFAVLQATVLPRDVLAGIGYSRSTISPYLLVDDNPALVRINSTLRGPNPLGAYAVVVLGFAVAIAMRQRLGKREKILLAAMSFAAAFALVASYSRSSLLAAGAAIVVAGLVPLGGKLRKRMALWCAVMILATGMVLWAARDSYFVSNVIMHNNPATGAAIDSNQGHVDSLYDGTARVLAQPLGAGVGSTGSASLLGEEPLIIENQYLFIAHEIGWLGLALYSWLYVEVMWRLWKQRGKALALGTFAGGVGLAFVGLLLPVWVDDTVSILWWGLAAIAIVGVGKGTVYGKRASHKKTARTA